jgi:hypothetical protein
VDDKRFDEFAKLLAVPASRRATVRSVTGGALAAMLGLLGRAGTDAKKKKGTGKSKKKSCSGFRKCGNKCCDKGKFCCDDARKLCCPKNAECCNIGSGTGSCCSPPNRCGKPWGNDAAPSVCCPPERQWFTATGIVRCCPSGTRSLGRGISSDDGPCCPEEKYCSTAQTGGKCCPDVAPICLNRSTGQCCDEANKCGTDCCGFGSVCCNGKCCPFGQICDGGTTCKCPTGVMQCGDTCCHAGAVGCEGSRCQNPCDLDNSCGG